MLNFKSFKLGVAFGIPVYVDVSFLFIAAMLLLGVGNPLTGALVAAGLGFSIVAHEFGHSLTARKYGFATRKITLSMIGGCAELEGIPKISKQEMLVALAGPGVSLLMVAAFFGCAIATSFFKPIMESFVWLSAINAALCAFNLLPGFPMDGGRVLRAWLSRKRPRQAATRIAMNVGRVFAVILACWGVFNVASGNIGGATSILISWFIWQAGWQEYMMSIYGG